MSDTRANENEEIFYGSDNLYADLGLPNAEEHMAKAKIVIRIAQLIEQHHLPTEQASDFMGICPEETIAILKGTFKEYSLLALTRYLSRITEKL
jgi:predicted XRE-type DNA-binding protein